MFEDYLEDSYYLALKARESTEEREKKRYYRASVFYAISSIEAFINYIGDTFAKGGVFEAYEIAFLNDKKFGISKKGFGILEQMEYHRLEEKIRFLISKFIPTFDFSHEIVWAHFVEFKNNRTIGRQLIWHLLFSIMRESTRLP